MLKLSIGYFCCAYQRLLELLVVSGIASLKLTDGYFFINRARMSRKTLSRLIVVAGDIVFARVAFVTENLVGATVVAAKIVAGFAAIG